MKRYMKNRVSPSSRYPHDTAVARQMARTNISFALTISSIMYEAPIRNPVLLPELVPLAKAARNILETTK
jgi:hypothetical protein